MEGGRLLLCGGRERAYPGGAHIEAMGKALEAMSASDARGFFEHRGYHAKVHLL
jgi:hypothetical protein